jgi:hypothetical protein
MYVHTIRSTNKICRPTKQGWGGYHGGEGMAKDESRLMHLRNHRKEMLYIHIGQMGAWVCKAETPSACP